VTPEFAICNQSSLDYMAFMFAVEASRLQLLDFCDDWRIPPQTVAPYADVTQLPVDATWLGFILDKLDEPGAAAYHTAVGDRPVLRMLAAYMPGDLGHEILETVIDATCDRWIPIGDGTEMAAECVDPVQGDYYTIQVKLFGETRPVEVPDYVLPPYWDRSQSGPTRKMEALGLRAHLEPFTIAPGGYAVILGRDGNEREVYGQIPGRKLTRPDSRLMRRLAR
jgi:hypothetical protein